MDQRSGRSFIIRDTGIEHNLVMQPIIPSGYVFIRNGKLAFNGMVWNLIAAEDHIEQLRQKIHVRSQVHGAQKYGWIETTVVGDTIRPIQPPEGTLNAMIKGNDKVDPADIPHEFNPVVPGGYYCMECRNMQFHQLHIRKEIPRMYPMLPAHYQPSDRIAVEEELEVIVMSATTVAEEGGNDDSRNVEY